MLNIQCFEVNMLGENCYLLWDETREAVIVDCGAFFDEEKTAISAFIAENELNICHLLNTHGHFDHIFGNAFVVDTYGVQPELAWDETDTYLAAAEQMRMFMHREMPLTVPPIGRSLMEGDDITFGSHKLQVIATPGHTPGGICFYCAEEGVLLSGDSLFRQSIGRCDLPGSDERALLTALREKILTLPNEVVVYPGHGPHTTVKFEKENNYYIK